MLMKKSKGITPVIAIVLLLLVTVGAVGVVYTQFQGLVQDPDTGFLEEVEIEFQTVTRESATSPDTMEIRIQNQGEEQYNLSEVTRMEYSIPGEQRLEFDTADALDGISTDPAQQDCMTDSAPTDIQEFAPGSTATCNTGVEMVDPDDEVTLYLVDQESGEEITSYTCSPSTDTSATC